MKIFGNEFAKHCLYILESAALRYFQNFKYHQILFILFPYSIICCLYWKLLLLYSIVCCLYWKLFHRVRLMLLVYHICLFIPVTIPSDVVAAMTLSGDICYLYSHNMTICVYFCYVWFWFWVWRGGGGVKCYRVLSFL